MYRNLTALKSLFNTPEHVLPPKHSPFAKARITLKTVFKKQGVG